MKVCFIWYVTCHMSENLLFTPLRALQIGTHTHVTTPSPQLPLKRFFRIAEMEYNWTEPKNYDLGAFWRNSKMCLPPGCNLIKPRVTRKYWFHIAEMELKLFETKNGVLAVFLRKLKKPVRAAAICFVTVESWYAVYSYSESLLFELFKTGLIF